MVEQGATQPAPAEGCSRRIVMLGASNLVRGMPTVLETALLCCGRPSEVFFACGHGRSYGITSRVFGRTLTGIVHCGLWKALQDRPPQATTALVTDVGNDLLYGQPVPEIAGWVESCVDRLLEHDARVVVTGLPLANLDTLSPARFALFRTLLFPGKRHSFEEIRARARQLDERLRQLTASRNLPLVEPRSAWYGFDPIHIRYRHAPGAWREVLAAWSETETSLAQRMSWWSWLQMHRLRPEQRWVWGIEQRGAQPALRCADGTTLWLY